MHVRDHTPFRVRRWAFEPRRAAPRAIVVQPRAPFLVGGDFAGTVPAATLGLPASCQGFFSMEPQHYFSLPDYSPDLQVEVQTRRGAALVIVAPDGQVWCDAKGPGSYPALAGSFTAGTYAVYVGTRYPSQPLHYQLSITSQPPAPVQPPAPAPLSCQDLVLSHGHPASAAAFCQGVNPMCAQALLDRGHHPSTLAHCRNAPIECAVSVLNHGHHPSTLVHCLGVDPQCAEAVLASGAHPSAIVQCRVR